MKKLMIVAMSSMALLAMGPAQAAPGDCAARAVSKEGKPLHGAAKTAFMKKCEADNPGDAGAAPAAATAAAGDGKTTQQNKMKQCNADAKGKTGEERKAFMKDCQSK